MKDAGRADDDAAQYINMQMSLEFLYFPDFLKVSGLLPSSHLNGHLPTHYVPFYTKVQLGFRVFKCRMTPSWFDECNVYEIYSVMCVC